MRRLCLALILIAAPAFADEKAKPNTLTPKEIADGWILLFDGETTFGLAPEGEVEVKNGALVVGGKKESAVWTTTDFGATETSIEVSRDGTTWKSMNYGKDSPSSPIAKRFSVEAGCTVYFRSMTV